MDGVPINQGLAGLFNFTPEPSWAQVIAWLAYLAATIPVFLRISFRPVRTSPQPA